MGIPVYSFPASLTWCWWRPFLAYNALFERIEKRPDGSFADVPTCASELATGMRGADAAYRIGLAGLRVTLCISAVSDMAGLFEATLWPAPRMSPPGGDRLAAELGPNLKRFFEATRRARQFFGRVLIASGCRGCGGCDACRSMFQAGGEAMERMLDRVEARGTKVVRLPRGREAVAVHRAGQALDEVATVGDNEHRVSVYAGRGVEGESQQQAGYVALGLSGPARRRRACVRLAGMCEAFLIESGGRVLETVCDWPEP